MFSILLVLFPYRVVYFLSFLFYKNVYFPRFIINKNDCLEWHDISLKLFFFPFLLSLICQLRNKTTLTTNTKKTNQSPVKRSPLMLTK